MKNTHKQKIINFVKNRDWVSGYEIEKYAIEAGGKPATFGRRAREIAEAGIFERRMNGKNVEYKYVNSSPTMSESIHETVTDNRPKQDPLIKVDYDRRMW